MRFRVRANVQELHSILAMQELYSILAMQITNIKDILDDRP